MALKFLKSCEMGALLNLIFNAVLMPGSLILNLYDAIKGMIGSE